MGHHCWVKQQLFAAVVCMVLLAAVPGVEGLTTQVSDNATCIHDGIDNTAPYRQAVWVGDDHFLPVFSSVDLSKPLKVDNLLIIQHGIAGNANTYFCDALVGVKPIKSIGVVAPYFGNEPVTLREWVTCDGCKFRHDGDDTSLFWDKHLWNQGGPAANAPNISSFDALDALLHRVTWCPRGRHRLGLCPKQVIVTGFSAGGQTIQRYAWATRYGAANATGRVKVKFVVSDPGTYLYFNAARANQSCRPCNGTSADWSCTDFVEYTADPKVRNCSTSAAKKCKNFNNWRLGVDGFEAKSPYLLAGTYDDMSAAYLTKDILYVYGENDVCNCLTPGYDNPPLCINYNLKCSPAWNKSEHCCDMPDSKTRNEMTDDSCGEMMQGSNRLQRGLLFMSYLRYYSSNLGVSFSPPFTTVPGMGHDANKLYNVTMFLDFLSS